MSISQEDLDVLILSCVKPWGTKVAAVIGHVDVSLKARALSRIPFDDTVGRVKGLIEAGRLRSEGNVDEWGASEVYLL